MDAGADQAAPPRPGALGALLAPVRGRLICAAALRAAAAVAALVPFICLAELGVALLGSQSIDAQRAWTLVWLAVAGLGVRTVLAGVADSISHFADNHLTRHVRGRLARHIGRVPLGWLGGRSSGRIKAAVQDDVAALHTLVAHAGNELTAAAVTPVAVVAYLAWVDWRLALVALAPLIIFGLVYGSLMRGQGDQMQNYVRQQAGINAAVVEYVHAIPVVRAFGEAGRAHARFARVVDEFASSFAAWMGPMVRAYSLAVMVVSGPAVLGTMAATGVLFAANGWIDPVRILPFLLLSLAITEPLLALNQSAHALRLARAAAARIEDILDTPPLTVAERPRRPADASVEFEDVHFGHGDTKVVCGVDAHLAPGSVTALVGPSGAGKTTLAQLVLRFHDVWQGAVRLGGVDVRDIAPEQLYRQVGFVFQEAGLLRISLADNIALGCPGADRARIVDAARAAHIHDRIVAMPDGYDTVVDQGVALSGGEAQRVAIARALMVDAPVLVLDEATAHADPEAEDLIQQALSRLVAGRTLLVVAHRLASVAAADQILVVRDGRIVERGRHDDLCAGGGWYAQTWRAQAAIDDGMGA